MARHSPQDLPASITFMCHFGILQSTTLLSSTFHVDGNAHLTWPIQDSIEEVMPLQSFVVLGATPGPLVSRALPQGSAQLKLAYLISHTSTPYTLSEPRGSSHGTT
jgi:hypothetical protein